MQKNGSSRRPWSRSSSLQSRARHCRLRAPPRHPTRRAAPSLRHRFHPRLRLRMLRFRSRSLQSRPRHCRLVGAPVPFSLLRLRSRSFQSRPATTGSELHLGTYRGERLDSAALGPAPRPSARAPSTAGSELRRGIRLGAQLLSYATASTRASGSARANFV